MLKYHKSEDTCRQCKHSLAHHCLYAKIYQGDLQQSFIQPLDIVPCDAFASVSASSTYGGKCGCLNWEPTDNLEYLELKSVQADEKTQD